MDSNAQQLEKVSPWLRIWLRPAFVFRLLVARRDTNFMHRLMILWSVTLMAGVMLPFWAHATTQFNPLEPLIQILVIAPFAGLIAGYTMGGALKAVGGWFGRKSTSDVMRMVNAWSLAPAILFRVVGMVAYLALRPEGNGMWMIHGIWIGGFIYSAIIRHAGIREALKMSTPLAIVVHLISYLIVLLPLGFLVGVYTLVLKTALHIQ